MIAIYFPSFRQPLLDVGMRRARPLLTLLLLLGFTAVGWASNIVEVSAVSDRILLLRFDDGHIDYGQTNGGNIIYNAALDTANIGNLGTWGISSSDDPNFSGVVRPVAVGRKSKAGDVNTLFVEKERQVVLDHWVYLHLPQPLTEGRTYTIDLGNYAANRETFDFTFDPRERYSESVHVNQLGFVPNSPKYAYVSQWMGDMNFGDIVDGRGRFEDYNGTRFDLVDVNSGQSVFNGTVQMRKRVTDGSPATNDRFDGSPFWFGLGGDGPPPRIPQNYTFSDVLEADFSNFTTPGTYKVVVSRMGCSFPFDIAADAFRTPFSYVMKGIFHQRAGIVLELPDGKVRPRDYHPDDLPLERFRYDRTRWLDSPGDKSESAPGDFNNEFLPVYGWYHDAGDWDTNPAHARVPFSLMLLYTLKPENFGDGDVGNRYKLNESDANWIDEGTDGLPDILNEARWLIDYYRRAKDVGLARGITTGGVPGGYAGVDAGAIDGFPSWEDPRSLRFMAEDPNQTFTYAAAAAWYASSLRLSGGNAGEVAEWISEAENAYTWAVNNATPADYELWAQATRRSRILADAALYRATTNTAYQSSFRDGLSTNDRFISGSEGWGAPEYWEYASVIYSLLPADFPGLDVAFQNEVKAKILQVADDNYIAPSEQRGYRVAFNTFKAHIIGMQSTPMLTLLLAASELSDDTKYIDAIHTSSAFFLGGNQEHITWINNVGEKSVKYPFHPNSWWLNDVNSKVYSNEIVTGYVPYGSYQSPDFFGFGFQWEGDEDFSKFTMYPRYEYQNWPLMEQRVENRTSIAGSENTVWQNNASAAMVYGFISNPSTGNYTFNGRPTVAIDAPDQIDADSGATLRANASGDTRRVGYWLEENFIGYSYDRAGNFAFNWKPLLPAGTNDLLLTAVAWDDKGLISLPSDSGDKLIDLVSGGGVTAIEIVPGDLQFDGEGETRQLEVVFTPSTATNQGVTWSSSDPSVVVVSADGLATASRVGIATITATASDNGVTDEISVRVGDFVELESFTVTPARATLSLSDTLFLVATFNPTNASTRELTYTNSNPNAFRVEDDGRIIPLAPGSGTVTVQVVGTDLSQQADINVTDPSCTGGLVNRDFFNGLEGWNTVLGTVSAAQDQGESVLLAPAESGGDQRIPRALAEGTTVTITARARTAEPDAFALLGIDFKDASDETITTTNVKVESTGYETIVYTLDAPAGTEAVNIWFYCGTGTLYVDEYCVDLPAEGSDISPSTTTPTLDPMTGSVGTDSPIEVNVFPNPSHREIVQLRLDKPVNGQITVHDEKGRLVRSLPIRGNSAEFRLLARGVYLVRVSDGVNNFVTKRLIVQ